MPYSWIIFTLYAFGACCCAVSASPAWGPSTQAPPSIELTADDQHVALQTPDQRVHFDRNEAGLWQLTTFVRHEDTWVPFFDGRRPLIQGSRFDLDPNSYEIDEDSNRRKAVLFRGWHQAPDYAWSCLVELRAGSPLIKFTLTCDLPQGLQIDSPQPTIALWLKQPTAEMTLDQGPVSQAGDIYRVPFNFGFPSAYLWDRQREAVIFFNMSPMTWFSPGGVHRFLDVQIKSEAHAGHLGLGLHTRHTSGSTIPAGAMVSEFYLYSRHRADLPTKFEALDQMIRVCAPLHPATSDFPQNTLEGGDVSWELFASRTIRDLMVEGVACSRLVKPWQDEPLSLVPSRDDMIVHPDWLPRDASTLPVHWNFPTVNHHLAPWLLFARLHPAADVVEFARIKKDAVPRFYDPTTRMIRSFLPPLSTTNAMEISWQSYVFYQEMCQIDEASATEDFNPAILGRLLMGLEGMIEYAHHVDYVFATYYNPVTHEPLPFFEHPELGCVREPWTVGSHAFVMMRASEVTGNRRYQLEATRAFEALLRTMQYTDSNQYHQRTFDDPVEMPSSDLTGNAYGAVAAWKLYEATGDTTWRQVARDALNTLLRQTLWHEDHSDAVNRELRHAGLFYPYVGAACTTPWETTEANLCLAWMLAHDTDSPLVPLLLKLSNLNRINSFYFYPAVYGPATRALTPSGTRIGPYFPIEPMYQLENMAGSIDSHGTAPYMAGNAIWNWWLYEALAEASDRDIMALNTASLDGYEEAISGAERDLIVFNPTPTRRDFALRWKHVAPGQYNIASINAAGAETEIAKYTAEELMAGIALNLDSLEYRRLQLRHDDYRLALERIQLIRTARHRLAYVYCILQDRATEPGQQQAENSRFQSEFRAAMADFSRGDFAQATRSTEALAAELAPKVE